MLIPFNELFSKYKISPRGVLHIGASTGQEAEAYFREGIEQMIFIEALPGIYRLLKKNISKYPHAIAINACISDEDGKEVTFNIANNEGQSSSMLDLGTHKMEHPSVKYVGQIRLTTSRVDTIFQKVGLDERDFDFLNIDLQGAELLALRGMGDRLRNVKYAYIEVNEKQLYKGCPLVNEIDDYLKGYGFKRVETMMTPHGWGDALYIKDEKPKDNMVEVPVQFQPRHPFKYPSDNDVEFERWYLENFTGSSGRTYLPVMWTAYYCKHKFGADIRTMAALQKFINALDKTKQYYTIVQYDDGIIHDLTGLDIKVFSMSGRPMDYPLPLICKPHQFTFEVERDLFASFIGTDMHPLRNELKQFTGLPGWHISSKKVLLKDFCSILARSVFALCPRGYGPTSFRIMEAMQYGAIPVYISDKFIIPHAVPFGYYGVLIRPDQVKDLPRILADVNVADKQRAVKEIYEAFFTYGANKKLIDENIQL